MDQRGSSDVCQDQCRVRLAEAVLGSDAVGPCTAVGDENTKSVKRDVMFFPLQACPNPNPPLQAWPNIEM